MNLILEKSYKLCTRLSDNFYRKPSKKETWLSGFGSEQKIHLPKSLEIFRTIYHDIEESEF
ncbi:MAG: hypothetical protein A2277_19465 [Desulfobacterales bacterium RIFOXYA12_FULL_46_15]|nr:MAG: hypothetical protein A2277_19465 [Desulfobacterales bacterium RIFOXYA12_FULL_46_15]